MDSTKHSFDIPVLKKAADGERGDAHSGCGQQVEDSLTRCKHDWQDADGANGHAHVVVFALFVPSFRAVFLQDSQHSALKQCIYCCYE